MKKELKVIAVVLAGIIVFLAGFGLGTSKGITIDVKVDGASAAANASASSSATPTPTPTPTPSQAPAETTTAAPASSAAADKPADNSSAGAPSAIPSSPKEIAAKYNEAVNALKQQKNITVHKTGSVTMECTDCSVSFLTNKVTDLLKTFMTDTDETITFTEGKGANSKGEEKTVNAYIVPGDREAAVTENDLASATAAAEGSGYKMTLKFKSEQATFDGETGQSTNPTSHMTAMDPLNLATLQLPAGAKITKADMTYPGATIEATVDGSGNLTKLHLVLPLEGSGTGKLVAQLSLSIKGQLDDTFEITY